MRAQAIRTPRSHAHARTDTRPYRRLSATLRRQLVVISCGPLAARCTPLQMTERAHLSAWGRTPEPWLGGARAHPPGRNWVARVRAHPAVEEGGCARCANSPAVEEVGCARCVSTPAGEELGRSGAGAPRRRGRGMRGVCKLTRRRGSGLRGVGEHTRRR